ncbi:hypothetical protein JHK82_047975 [Glycine max]|nr:hypothetical protein JHK82_047975 [Glycine max]
MNPICAKVQNLQTKIVNKTIKNGAREWDSVMYRSFLRCDDPKGVVECGIIRKYKTRSHKVKDKTKILKTGENLETSLSLMNKRYKEENKALRESLDTTHFKGILKESFVKEPKLHVHHFNDTNSKQFGDLSHIALMKPQCTLYQESVKSTYMLVPPKELPITKLKPEIASSKTIKHRKGSSSTNMGKEMKKGICKWVNKEEGPKFLKEVMKLDAKGINPVEESSGKVKLYCHIGHTS